MFPFVEAFKMAVTAIWSHKLRSALTLVGIIAGVASIIAVMTGISVVQGTIEKEMSVLGTTVFQVQKWGRGFDDVDWREIQKRKPVTVENAAAIRENVDNVTMVGSELWDFGHSARYRNETAERVTICGGTPEYPENNTHYVYLGRNISHEDVSPNTIFLAHGNIFKLN